MNEQEEEDEKKREEEEVIFSFFISIDRRSEISHYFIISHNFGFPIFELVELPRNLANSSKPSRGAGRI